MGMLPGMLSAAYVIAFLSKAHQVTEYEFLTVVMQLIFNVKLLTMKRQAVTSHAQFVSIAINLNGLEAKHRLRTV